MYTTKPTNPRTLLILTIAALLIAAAIAQSPFARAADFTAATETELAAAIAAANAAGAGNHAITLTADITLIAPLPALNNPIASGITLDGAGHTLDADGTGTALVVAPSTLAAIENLTITGGAGSRGPNGQSGGGIFNQGTLIVTDAIIADNAASQGAGIFNYAGEKGAATLTLVRVTLRDNEASAFGGGLANTGDAGATIVTITDSVIADNNAASYGGGIASHGHSGIAIVTLGNTTVSGNSASYGGGIFNNGNGGQVTLRLTGVTLSGNTVTAGGGGLFNNGNNGTAAAELLNTTLSGNAARIGGGVMNSGNGGEANLSLAFTTVAANTANAGAGGLHITSGATTTAVASILAAGSQGKTCVMAGSGSLTSGGYNLDSDDSCGLGGPGDIGGGNAGLLPLAINAPGSTATHALEPGSDAQRKVPSGAAGCGAALSTDQRGATRPNPAPSCDIGAYESDAAAGGATPTPTATGAPPSPTPTATGTPPSPTPTATPPVGCVPPYGPTNEAQLNAAIACVNAAGDGTHTITLAADIDLTGPAAALSNPAAVEIILDGASHTLNGGRKGTVLTILGPTRARVRNVTVTGGQGSSGPTGNWAGGIFNTGRLVIENSTLYANIATQGGGVVNYGDGAEAGLTIIRSTISNNFATGMGGGIANVATNGGSAATHVENATLTGNRAVAGGGGLFNEATNGNGTTTFSYATLNINTADGGGGGIHTAGSGGGSAVVLSATIVSNGLGAGPDCAAPGGSILSLGYNLAGDGTCNLNQTGDQPAANAGLLPQAVNPPGDTATHALVAGSPALNRIPKGAAGCGAAFATDQRGAPRPFPAGGFCDVGAYESQTEPGATPFRVYLPIGMGE